MTIKQQKLSFPPTSTHEAIMRIEGDTSTETECIQAWQYLIDTGMVWQLQGSYGRMAAHLIDEGICTIHSET
jgi:hypothetical protein